jgi:hypothetical protein
MDAEMARRTASETPPESFPTEAALCAFARAKNSDSTFAPAMQMDPR